MSKIVEQIYLRMNPHLAEDSATTKKPTITKKAVTSVVKALAEEIAHQLKTEGSVQVQDIATFKSKVRQARAGRNMRTGEAVTIAEKTVVVAKPAKPIRDLFVNSST